MMLTDYPFNRALVAERQRERRLYAEEMRRFRPMGDSDPARFSVRRTFAGWLLGRSRKGRPDTWPT